MFGFWGDILNAVGSRLMSAGGFWLDDQDTLTEDYEEEDWPEENYCGYESQDGEDLGWSDCIWRNTECDCP